MPVNGTTYFASSTTGTSITPGFSGNSAIGLASVKMAIDGTQVANGVPKAVSGGNHSYTVTAVDNWGIESTTAGAFSVVVHVKR